MGCLGEDDVLDFVEGRGSEEGRAGVAGHLDGCDACRELVAHTARALMPTANEAGGKRVAPLEQRLPDAGDVIGRYRVIGRLGRGAMGLVLAAEHLELRRRVALKVVLPDAERREVDAQLRARLLREARAASAIRHPNVVTVHDVITLDDGSPVMVMDLLEGETLRARLERDGRLSAPETLALARQLAAALAAAHAHGVVHRDLKPDNVFLAEEGGAMERRRLAGPHERSAVVVKIVDFGIAKLTAVDGPAAQTAGLTQTGMLVGTPHYMAPEQAFADGEIDARADLWALGVIVYECLTGARPFEGDNVGQVLRRLARATYRPLEEAMPDAPPALAELVGRLLCERELRLQSAEAVGQELDASHDASGELSSRRGADARTLAPTSVSRDGLAVTQRSWLGRVGGERSWLLALAAAALAVVVGLLAREPARAGRFARGDRAEAVHVDARAAARPPVTPPPPSSAAPPPPAPVAVHAPRSSKPVPAPAPAPAPAPVASPGPGRLITKPPF